MNQSAMDVKLIRLITEAKQQLDEILEEPRRMELDTQSAILAYATVHSIVTTLLWYQGWAEGAAETRKIYEGKKV